MSKFTLSFNNFSAITKIVARLNDFMFSMLHHRNEYNRIIRMLDRTT